MVTTQAAEGVVDSLPIKVLRHQLSGSAWFFGAGNDVDILIETPDLIVAAHLLVTTGWEVAHEDGYPLEDGWFSAKKGVVNLLVCAEDSEHWYAMVAGATVCKALALHGSLRSDDKATRVLIHRALTGEEIDFGLCVMRGGEVIPR